MSKRPFYVALDAEWQSKTGEAVTVQFSLESGTKFIFINNQFKDQLPVATIEAICERLIVIPVWADLSSGDWDCLEYISKTIELPKKLTLLMFYSPKDLMLLHGRRNFDRLVLPETNLEGEGPIGQITQKRNIKARYKTGKHTINIRDLKGWTVGSLKALAASVAVELTDKGAMDKYKTEMLTGLIEEPENYLKYAIGDTDCLFDIYREFTTNVQKLQSASLSIPESECYTTENIPMTTGSLVANSVRKYLENTLGSPGVAPVVFRKLGELDLSQPVDRLVNGQKARRDFFKTIRSLDSLREFFKSSALSEAILPGEPGPLQKAYGNLMESEYATQAYSLASPQVFGRDTKTTAAHLAPVHGGRALNEIPNEYRLENVLDADLSSAYATAMCSLIYPVGLPRVESFTGNQERFTLREALKKIEGKATPGCWMIVVSGKLPFAQDLILSKLVSAREINKAMVSGGGDDTEENDDLTKIPGPVVHLRREIVNGVITTDVLETIKKVASNQEYKAFLELQVVAMAYHLETEKFTDFDAWADFVLKDTGEVKSVNGQVTDTRTRAWFALPLSDIFGKLTNERKAIKKRAKELKPRVDSGDAEAKHAYDRHHADQEARKLFINTGYGTIASVYFPIGNSIVGNNITAKVRVNAWMMAKALRCPQIITDGGLFSTDRVRFIKGSILPSMNTLASHELLDKHRSVKLGALAGLEWREKFEQAVKNPSATISIFQAADAERLTNEHINAFWKPWGLQLGFAIELKTGHEAVSAAYLGKADYCLKLPTGKYEYRIRGARYFENGENKSHPKYGILTRLADGVDEMTGIALDYDHTYLLKIGRYQQANRSTGWQHLAGIAPGEEVVEHRHWRFNNGFIPMDTEEDYRRVERRGLRKNDDGLFDRYLDRGWKYTLDMALTNKLTNNAR